jgi:FKBP12-rapamycin complex-associated protein
LPALFQCIKVEAGPEQSVKATLLALTLWFRFGGTERKVLTTVKAYLKETPTRTWLPAIPQLIARLGAKDMALRYSLIDFLMQIAGTYADALIWPLLTASQTPRSVHQSAALDIMQQMAASPELTTMIKQAQMVGKELILSAISPVERWKNAIEKVSSMSSRAFRDRY